MCLYWTVIFGIDVLGAILKVCCGAGQGNIEFQLHFASVYTDLVIAAVVEFDGASNASIADGCRRLVVCSLFPISLTIMFSMIFPPASLARIGSFIFFTKRRQGAGVRVVVAILSPQIDIPRLVDVASSYGLVGNGFTWIFQTDEVSSKPNCTHVPKKSEVLSLDNVFFSLVYFFSRGGEGSSCFISWFRIRVV